MKSEEAKKLKKIYRSLYLIGIMPLAIFGTISCIYGWKFSIYITIPFFGLSCIFLVASAYFIGRHNSVSDKKIWF